MAGEALQIVGGSLAGRELTVDDELVLGRTEPGLGALGEDSQLSRRHARLRRGPGGELVVEDLGSTNGTWVNGERVTAPRVLVAGDRLTLGGTTIEVARAPAAGIGPLPAFSHAPTETVSGRGPRVRLVLAGVVLVALVAAAIVVAATSGGGSSSGTGAGSSGKGGSAVANRCVRADSGRAGPGHFLFVTSACENASSTVATLSLHKGTSGGQTVWYVVMDSSNRADARARGVNFAPKLANAAKVPGAVQSVTLKSGVIDFPATVDFGPQRVLVAGPQGFPPAKAVPGAVGRPGYSPLVRLPNGTVLDAPQVANATGQGDKVVRLDTGRGRVDYKETEGRYENKHVHYASFDASTPTAAAIEDVTLAPAMNKMPAPDQEGVQQSAREQLDGFVNGPTGLSNPERQGINSAILDKMDPHNILHEAPRLPLHDDVGNPAYSPIWDAHLAAWTKSAIDSGARVEVTSTPDLLARVKEGVITAPGGKRFAASGFDVTCPLISIDLP